MSRKRWELYAVIVSCKIYCQ